MNPEELRKHTAEQIEADGKIKRVQEKIGAGTAGMADSQAYALRAGEITGKALAACVPEFTPEERSSALFLLLRDRYKAGNAVFDAIQTALDEAQGLHMRVRHAAFPEQRAKAMANALSKQDAEIETVQRRAESAANIVAAMHDANVRANAEFRDRAGLRSYATRDGGSHCCDFCAGVEGRYPASEVPDGFWGRHDHCGCSISYECGRRRGSGRARRDFEHPAPDAGAGDPVVLTAEEAKALQDKKRLHVLTNGAESAKMSIGDFNPAKTIEEANTYARDVLGIRNANYQGCDILVANEWNKGLAEAFSRFPELRDDFGFAGSLHERHSLVYALSRKYYGDWYDQNHPEWSESRRRKAAQKAAEAEYNKYASVDYSDTYAVSNHDSRPYLAGIHGISVNSSIVMDSPAFFQSLSEEVQTHFHPDGCNTIRSILDHEIGHRLDDLVGASQDAEIQRIIDELSTSELTNQLSSYAWDNDGRNDRKKKYSESIAEAWSEYCNNQHCRPVALRIGKRIEELYHAKFGGVE